MRELVHMNHTLVWVYLILDSLLHRSELCAGDQRVKEVHHHGVLIPVDQRYALEVLQSGFGICQKAIKKS